LNGCRWRKRIEISEQAGIMLEVVKDATVQENSLLAVLEVVQQSSKQGSENQVLL
jgi:hypothetical protein